MIESRNIIAFGKADKTLAVILLSSLFLTYSLFLHSPYNDSNVTSRIALTLSLVQDGTLSIDRFQEFTIDKAYFNGSFYSDKAPGMAILSVPLVYSTNLILKMLGKDKPLIVKGKLIHISSYVYVSSLLTSGLFTAAAAAMLFLTARNLGATRLGALFGALSYGLASPAFGWATTFFGHATAGASLFLAFAAVVWLQRGSPNPRHPLLLSCCAGGFLGLSIVVEFTTVPAAVVMALLGLRVAIGLHNVQRWRVLCSALIPGAVMLTLLGVYNYLVFASPLHIGYQSEVLFAEQMNQGFMGIGVPKLDVLREILFGWYRGLFTFSPILFWSFWSTVDSWRKGLLSSEHFVCIVAVVTSFLMINSGFVAWDGGASTGPRYLTPMIAFLCLPLALQWSRVGPIFRGILLISFMVSVGISLAATSVTMTVWSDYELPLRQVIIPKFVRGDLPSSVFGAAGWPAWTVMIPLIIIWVISVVIVKRLLREEPQAI
jgi:hypothetical protein